MTNLLGLPLAEALRRLGEQGIAPEILRTAGRREAADGTERVIRISEDGRRLTVARFPDTVRMEQISGEDREA